METVTLKRLVLLSFSAAALLSILSASGSPVPRCSRLLLYKFKAETAEEARKLRIKYEHLMKKQPWQNCSAIHLQPTWQLSNLTGWDKLEAAENVVSLYVQVLQNHSKGVADEISKQVLDILKPLQEDLRACIIKKPSGRNALENLQRFKEEFRKFKDGNLEQSPKCLEAAVGLDLHRLLRTDIRHLLRKDIPHLFG